jgi:pimeloyl-ACP methyl ester carboxylesterase
MVQDLERLLRVARVPAPYLLIGHSAGGELVRLFASRNPTRTTGFLAINSVPVASAWLPRVLPRFTPSQRREELAYYAGDNPESIAWRASAKALAAARAPRGMPYTMMISTIAECAGEPAGGPCHRSHALYTKLQRALATQTPQGRFVIIAGQHELYLDHPQEVMREIQRLLSLAR